MFYRDQMDPSRLVEIVSSHTSGSSLCVGAYHRCRVYYKEGKSHDQKPVYVGLTDLTQKLFGEMSDPRIARIGFVPA